MGALRVTALVVAVGGLAAHGGVRKVAVVVVALDARAQPDALVAGRALAPADPRFELVDPSPRPLARDQAEHARLARAAFTRGVDALDAVDYGPAIAHLTTAIREALESDLTTGFPLLLDAIGMRAVGLRLSGDQRTANEELARLFAMSPSYALSPGRWPPAIQKWIDQGQARARTAPPATLAVSTPVPAFAWVDGVARGPTPVKVSVLPGTHLVTLVAPGYATRQLELKVPTRGAEVAPALDAVPESQAWLSLVEELRAGLRGSLDEPAGRLLASAGVDEVVVVGLELKGDELHATAVRQGRGGRIATLSRALGPRSSKAPADLQGLVVALLERPELPATATATAQRPGPSRRTWGLVAIGAGTALAAGGLIAGLNAKAQADAARLTPQLEDAAWRRAAGSARTTAAVADTLYVLAAAGAGTGLYLLLTSGASPSPAVSVGVGAGPGGAVVSVGGRF